MRPHSFDPKTLRQYLLRHKIATLPELKRALGTDVDLTVFRKLKPLDYLSSYTHRGRYYTLSEIARFDDTGLWSHEAVWFSRYGTLAGHRGDLRQPLPSRASSPMNSPTHCTPKYRTPSASWSNRASSAEPKWTATSCTLRSIVPPIASSF